MPHVLVYHHSTAMSDKGTRPKQDCPPFLRWAGSKRLLLPDLQTYWTKNHKRYLEPFAGSARLFFALKPPRAILGDLNPVLISTYLEIKYRLEGVLHELKLLPSPNKEAYIELRSVNEANLTKAAQAARFIYLNRYCFNGIYRTNLRGEFNVPYGGEKSGRMPPVEVFRKCSRRMQNTRFVKGDFERVLQHAQKGDLVYMDPPFAVGARRVFRQYDPSTFTHKDIQRLRWWMKKLNAAKIDFVVSYADSEEANLLRKDFGFEEVSVRRHIAGFAAHRAVTKELIISNV